MSPVGITNRVKLVLATGTVLLSESNHELTLCILRFRFKYNLSVLAYSLNILSVARNRHSELHWSIRVCGFSGRADRGWLGSSGRMEEETANSHLPHFLCDRSQVEQNA